MCDKCSNIDYPIGDSIWLPCGGPASRYPGRKKPMAFTEDDTHTQQKIVSTVKFVRKQEEASRQGFEGLFE